MIIKEKNDPKIFKIFKIFKKREKLKKPVEKLPYVFASLKLYCCSLSLTARGQFLVIPV